MLDSQISCTCPQLTDLICRYSLFRLLEVLSRESSQGRLSVLIAKDQSGKGFQCRQ